MLYKKLNWTPLVYSKNCFFYEKVELWTNIQRLPAMNQPSNHEDFNTSVISWWRLMKKLLDIGFVFFGSAGVRSRLKMSKNDLPQTRICNYKYVVAGYVCRKSLAISKKNYLRAWEWFVKSNSLLTVGPITPSITPRSSRLISEKAASQATRALRFSPMVCKTGHLSKLETTSWLLGWNKPLKPHERN